jgi:uncharacterized protein (DUF362 family)
MIKLKSIVIYGIIILLLAAAVVGYVKSGRQTVNTGNTEAAVSSAAIVKAETSAGSGDTEAANSTNAETSDSQSTAVDAAPTDNGNAAASTEAVGVNGGNATGNVADKEAHVKEIMVKSVAAPDPNPVVGIGRGEDYPKVTEEAVKNAGGLQDTVKKGDLVVIKPNICTLDEAGSCMTTDYRTVQKIVEMVKGLGASRVIIAEGTIAGNAFAPAYLRVNKYDTIKGVELLNLNALNEEDCYELKPDKSMTGKALFIPKIYMDADVVISVAKLKTHFQPDAVVSLSLKNSIGVPPGRIYGVGSKDGLHNLGLKESIVDINKIRKPDFLLIEGIVGGEGYGPINNTPVKSDIIFAGKDPVALDTVALTFMGYKAEDIPHVKLASDEKLGISDLGSIKVIGAVLDKIKMKFRGAYE